MPFELCHLSLRNPPLKIRGVRGVMNSDYCLLTTCFIHLDSELALAFVIAVLWDFVLGID